jgi:hypothetical protein
VDNELPLSRKSVGFVLTLIVVPVLFVSTCVPVGFVAIGMDDAFSSRTIPIFTIYGAVFLAFAIWRAIVAENPGVRWGIIVALAAAAIAAVLWFIPNVTGIGR